jgi:hypothetical protein
MFWALDQLDHVLAGVFSESALQRYHSGLDRGMYDLCAADYIMLLQIHGMRSPEDDHVPWVGEVQLPSVLPPSLMTPIIWISVSGGQIESCTLLSAPCFFHIVVRY